MRTNAPSIFWGAIAALTLATALYTKVAISGDWFHSGNDMQFILKDLRTRHILNFWSGPWAGQEMFRYYRPVTSTVFAWELNRFGTDVTRWQTLGWILHLASIPLLAWTLLNLLNSKTSALAGTALWALRDRISLTIEWVPAQTDLLAGFFATLCLTLFLLYLQRGYRAALITSVLAGVLSALSKETGFILVGLVPSCVLICTHNYRFALRVLATALLLGAALLALRWFALSGTGFLPGQQVGGGVAANPGVASILSHWSAFLLPEPLGPYARHPLANWAFSLGILAALLLRARLILSAGAFVAGLCLAVLILGDPTWLLLSSTWKDLLNATWCFIALVFALKTDLPRGVGVMLYGISAALPLYHVVYNPAGNVTYLPGTFHALYWSWILTAISSSLLSTVKLSSPERVAKS